MLERDARDRTPKFKRCKISRSQLVVLTQHFESDPLPSFEKRQALAQQLGMTPRSVQIWFQNRRQRLLKPLRQSEGSELSTPPPLEQLGYAPESLPETSSDSGSSTDLPRKAKLEMAPAAARMPLHPALTQLAHQHTYPMMAAQLAHLLGPFLHAEGVHSSTAMPATIAHISTALAAGAGSDGAPGVASPAAVPIHGQAAWGALGDNVGAGAAVLLAHALQQQFAAGIAAQGHPDDATSAAHPAAVPCGIRRDAGPMASQDGVDGLLLLSACADAQPPVPSSTIASTSSSVKGMQPVQFLPPAMVMA